MFPSIFKSPPDARVIVVSVAWPTFTPVKCGLSPVPRPRFVALVVALATSDKLFAADKSPEPSAPDGTNVKPTESPSANEPIVTTCVTATFEYVEAEVTAPVTLYTSKALDDPYFAM